ncbi:hypothetical protein [Leptolyngbya sp. BC1307]|uniref:hypothetical protein n=1 Tax=Leptolyngbya sp. BC1307 TaxID=2029589 RepID=UPI000EFBDA08|nr:hypothetical protein [Leptolyngbya sp. BC1307]
MSDPVLSQLVSVETDLAQQVETLETKLSQLQEQRQGLRTVINMFQASDGEEAVVSEPALVEPMAEEPAAEEPAAEEPVAEKSEPAAKKTTKTAAKAKSGREPKADKTSTPRKKKDGRAANWQKYVQAEYHEAALPEAVSSVLRSQPSEVFTIADVMSSIFSEDMPRPSFLKARNRISNILSAGARDGTWYRGRNGRYSQSESVTKAK